jgi:excisionase family DNA binding protein
MLTVPAVARRTGLHPETIRRWVRSGRLRSTKVGTQHVIEESELERVLGESDRLAVPPSWGWDTMADGSPMPDVDRWVGDSRRGR